MEILVYRKATRYWLGGIGMEMFKWTRDTTCFNITAALFFGLQSESSRKFQFARISDLHPEEFGIGRSLVAVAGFKPISAKCVDVNSKYILLKRILLLSPSSTMSNDMPLSKVLCSDLFNHYKMWKKTGQKDCQYSQLTSRHEFRSRSSLVA